MMLFSDPCLIIPHRKNKYSWFYDPQYQLFGVLPKKEQMSLDAQQLWDAFIACVPLLQKQQVHDFQWSIDSLEGLISHCQPQYIWLCIDEELPLKLSHLNHSPTPSIWLTHPLIKRQVWHLWQKILNNLA